MILAKNGKVKSSSLPYDVRHHHSQAETETKQPGEDNQSALDSHSKEILDALDKSNGNRAEAARLLGIDRSTLWRRMHRLNII
jgi:transcriptional regulator of acetoin/glycerol metabolism